MCLFSKGNIWGRAGEWFFWQWRWTTGFPLNSSLGLPSPQDRCSLSHNCNITAVFRLVQRPSRTPPVHRTPQKLSPFPSRTAKSAFHLTRTDGPPSPRGGHGGHRARRTSQLPRATRAARPRKAQRWRGGRAKAAAAGGTFEGQGVTVQLRPPATGEPSRWAGLEEVPCYQHATSALWHWQPPTVSPPLKLLRTVANWLSSHTRLWTRW